ncbi:MAG: hypothetical protein EBR82_35355 [Caulobacteraceae bacterium]|nr:hypothetical protein [Caulobacteraceae bacterium]
MAALLIPYSPQVQFSSILAATPELILRHNKSLNFLEIQRFSRIPSRLFVVMCWLLIRFKMEAQRRMKSMNLAWATMFWAAHFHWLLAGIQFHQILGILLLA